MANQKSYSRSDVMRAFAMEANVDHGALERYIAQFPQFVTDFVDLSREIASLADENTDLSKEDELKIQASLERYRNRQVKAFDLSTLSVSELRMTSEHLQLPLQVMVAFRERRVDLSTVPARFMEKFASALHTTKSALESFFELPPQVSFTRASKSSSKPSPAMRAPFEKVLSDAGVPAERVSELVKRDD